MVPCSYKHSVEMVLNEFNKFYARRHKHRSQSPNPVKEPGPVSRITGTIVSVEMVLITIVSVE